MGPRMPAAFPIDDVIQAEGNGAAIGDPNGFRIVAVRAITRKGGEDSRWSHQTGKRRAVESEDTGHSPSLQ